MRKKIRVIPKAANQFGPSPNNVRLDVKAHLDLDQAQDIVDAVPNLEFTMSNLQAESPAKAEDSLPDVCREPLVISGGGVRTTIRLSGDTALAVLSVIKEIHIRMTDLAA